MYIFLASHICESNSFFFFLQMSTDFPSKQCDKIYNILTFCLKKMIPPKFTVANPRFVTFSVTVEIINV